MEALRLSKRMAELGLCSRREADEWIEKGWVSVDGTVVAQLGAKILPTQTITLDTRARKAQAGLVTVILHKPIGIVSGQAEGGHRPAITLVTPTTRWDQDAAPLRFVREHLQNLAPAGRLDIDSTGLLVLTQDGRIARQLIGENSMVEKEYLVRVEGSLTPAGLSSLCLGLSLDGKALKRADVTWQNAEQLKFILTEGKKRQIRRMCELVGLKVLGLKRVRIGALKLGQLPVGRWRYLLPGEAI
jgi:23S rRNA pseudouridine2604 synthase